MEQSRPGAMANVGERTSDNAGVLMHAATQAAAVAYAGPPAARAREVCMVALDSMTQSPKHQHGKRVRGSGAQRRWRCGGAARMPPSGGPQRQRPHSGSAVGTEASGFRGIGHLFRDLCRFGIP